MCVRSDGHTAHQDAEVGPGEDSRHRARDVDQGAGVVSLESGVIRCLILILTPLTCSRRASSGRWYTIMLPRATSPSSPPPLLCTMQVYVPSGQICLGTENIFRLTRNPRRVCSGERNGQRGLGPPHTRRPHVQADILAAEGWAHGVRHSVALRPPQEGAGLLVVVPAEHEAAPATLDIAPEAGRAGLRGQRPFQ